MGAGRALGPASAEERLVVGSVCGGSCVRVLGLNTEELSSEASALGMAVFRAPRRLAWTHRGRQTHWSRSGRCFMLY